MRLLTMLVMVLTSHESAAICVKLGDFAGYSARAADQYVFSKDQIADTTFKVHFDGEWSRVEGLSSLSCYQAGSFSIVCVGGDEGKVVTETWTVDAKSETAFYTKTTSGYGEFDGVRAFVGRIHGGCG